VIFDYFFSAFGIYVCTGFGHRLHERGKDKTGSSSYSLELVRGLIYDARETWNMD
jgi:hypothetical protein